MTKTIKTLSDKVVKFNDGKYRVYPENAVKKAVKRLKEKCSFIVLEGDEVFMIKVIEKVFGKKLT